MQDSNSVLNEVTNGEYKYGFVTDIDTDVIHRGLDEETVRIISAKKHEPEWLLEFRLRALLANIRNAGLGFAENSAYRLSGYYLLRGSC